MTKLQPLTLSISSIPIINYITQFYRLRLCSFESVPLFQSICESGFSFGTCSISVIWRDMRATIWGMGVLFHPLKNERISGYIYYFTKLPFTCLWDEVMGLGCGERWPCVEVVVWLLWRDGGAVMRDGSAVWVLQCYYGGDEVCCYYERGDGGVLLLWEGMAPVT